MRKLLYAALALAALVALAVPAHAQHRACFTGGCRVGVGYGSFGYGSVATFASPFVVATPFVPAVAISVPTVAAVSVPTVVSTPVASSPVVTATAPVVASAFPVAVASPVVAVSTSAVVTPTYVFGVHNHRVFRYRR